MLTANWQMFLALSQRSWLIWEPGKAKVLLQHETRRREINNNFFMQ